MQRGAPGFWRPSLVVFLLLVLILVVCRWRERWEEEGSQVQATCRQTSGTCSAGLPGSHTGCPLSWHTRMHQKRCTLCPPDPRAAPTLVAVGPLALLGRLLLVLVNVLVLGLLLLLQQQEKRGGQAGCIKMVRCTCARFSSDGCVTHYPAPGSGQSVEGCTSTPHRVEHDAWAIR